MAITFPLTMPLGAVALDNPSFEQGDTGWSHDTGNWFIENDVGNAFDGFWRLRRSEGTSGASASRNRYLPVRPGQLLTASCRGKRNAGNANASVRIYWFTEAKGSISFSTGNVITTSSFMESLLAAAIAPANAGWARVAARSDAGGVASTVYFDAFRAWRELAPRAARLVQMNRTGLTRDEFTGKSRTVAWPGEWWAGEIAPPTQAHPEWAEWAAWLGALRGQQGTFLYSPWWGRVPRGVATGTPLVNGAGQGGAKTLNTKGWTFNTLGILRAGDYFQLGSGATSRLYQVLRDADSDGSGNAALEIFPAVRDTPADNATIRILRPEGVFRLATDIRSGSFEPGRVGSFEAVPIVEAF